MTLTEYRTDRAPTQPKRPRTYTADVLRERVRVTADGRYYWVLCPDCGTALAYRWAEHGHTHEPRGKCHTCGYRAWLRDMDGPIADAVEAALAAMQTGVAA